jgi:hypothetical protein
MTVDGAEVTQRTTLATAMTAYNDATLALTNASPFPVNPPAQPARVRLSAGVGATPATVYTYTGKSGNTLTGVAYLAGPHTAWPAGTTVQGHLGSGGRSANVGLNGPWFYALAYQVQHTAGATQALWKARGDALRLALLDTTPDPAGLQATTLSTDFWPKELPEFDLVGSCWKAEVP